MILVLWVLGVGVNMWCGYVIPRVWVWDIKPLAEQFVRVPLKCFPGHLSKHLHLNSSLLVIQVTLTKTKNNHYYQLLRCHSLREVDLTIQDATFLSSPATTTLSSSLCFALVKRDESTEDMGRYEVEVGTIVFPAPLCSLSIRSSLKESREFTWVCMLRRCWRSSGFSKSITELESENIYCIYCLTTKGIPDIDLPNLGQQS